MKKLVALTLALCLLGGAAALAENTFTHEGLVSGQGKTEVTYTVEPNTEFTVTIPSAVAIDPETFAGSMELALSAPAYNVRGGAVTVELVPGERSLKNGDTAVPYVLADGKGEFASDAEVSVLGWQCDGVTTAVSSTLTVTAEKRGDLPAGLYTDQLTFKVIPMTPATPALPEANP